MFYDERLRVKEQSSYLSGFCQFLELGMLQEKRNVFALGQDFLLLLLDQLGLPVGVGFGVVFDA